MNSPTNGIFPKSANKANIETKKSSMPIVYYRVNQIIKRNVIFYSAIVGVVYFFFKETN